MQLHQPEIATNTFVNMEDPLEECTTNNDVIGGKQKEQETQPESSCCSWYRFGENQLAQGYCAVGISNHWMILRVLFHGCLPDRTSLVAHPYLPHSAAWYWTRSIGDVQHFPIYGFHIPRLETG